jgi:hypothetical protein
MTVARSPEVLTMAKGLLRDRREESQSESSLVVKLS